MNVFLTLLCTVLFVLLIWDIKTELMDLREDVVHEIAIFEDMVDLLFKTENHMIKIENQINSTRTEIENLQKLYLSEIKQMTKKE